jgi:hypothetical protein
MKYDIATKVLMDKAGKKVLERFLDIELEDLEYIEDLPQETASLKRSDYILKVVGKDGGNFILIWEFLSTWKRKSVLNLIIYTARALLKYALPAVPVILLLRPSGQAVDHFEESGLSFKYKLIRLDTISAAEFMKEAEVELLPFVPAMEGGSEVVWEAEKKIYESGLPLDDKADFLTALAIFAGLRSKELTRKLVERRRDIMIESYAYEIIKQEGIEEGIQQGELKRARKAVYEVLDARFDLMPRDIVEAIEKIEAIPVLENLHRKAVKVNDLDEFREILGKI